MQEFFEIARTDFAAAFEGAWIFPILLLSIVWIIWQEKDWTRKILFGILPLVFLVIYWCPVTGLVIMKILGEDVYWRILWLLLVAAMIPYAGCLILKKTSGIWRQGAFLVLLLFLTFGGKKVLSEEWFEISTNVYKIPQNVVAVCDLLPGNIHAMVSNRLMPYIRMYDPTITLEYGRNALGYNVITDGTDVPEQILYLEAQKSEIDLSVLMPLAKQEACTFLIFSKNRTYLGEWEDYGYRKYGETDEFHIFVDMEYEEGQDTRKWED